MNKVILFGATGNLGKEIARELVNQQYDVTLVARSEQKAKALSHITNKYIVADVCSKNPIVGICENYDIVISALGKSVSLNDFSKANFREVDLFGNSHILAEAIHSKIKKFVYVSAFHAEKYLHLEYFKVHHEFSELLKKSRLNYSIIKPPAIFCAYADIITMAQQKRLFHLGKGEKKTNPIYEGDLAKIIVDSIAQNNTTIEAGGKTIYTRRKLNEIIQAAVNKNKKIRTIPLAFVKATLPLMRFFDKNRFDKFAFFTEVLQHDTVAPQVGELSFEDYVYQRLKS